LNSHHQHEAGFDPSLVCMLQDGISRAGKMLWWYPLYSIPPLKLQPRGNTEMSTLIYILYMNYKHIERRVWERWNKCNDDEKQLCDNDWCLIPIFIFKKSIFQLPSTLQLKWKYHWSHWHKNSDWPVLAPHDMSLVSWLSSFYTYTHQHMMQYESLNTDFPQWAYLNADWWQKLFVYVSNSHTLEISSFYLLTVIFLQLEPMPSYCCRVLGRNSNFDPSAFGESIIRQLVQVSVRIKPRSSR